MAVQVECYAGYRAEETPRCFFLEERKIEVLEVLSRWQEPGLRYFKVRGDDENTYILSHNVVTGQWELTSIELSATRK
jgi:hypothetical protein